jgi:hypothetical protein
MLIGNKGNEVNFLLLNYCFDPFLLLGILFKKKIFFPVQEKDKKSNLKEENSPRNHDSAHLKPCAKYR